jgi:hypothetical protein
MIQVIQEGAKPQSLAKTAIKLRVPEKRTIEILSSHGGEYDGLNKRTLVPTIPIME